MDVFLGLFCYFNNESEEINTYSPEQISVFVLSKLKKSDENFLYHEIKKVVITIPTYFSERQIQAIK